MPTASPWTWAVGKTRINDRELQEDEARRGSGVQYRWTRLIVHVLRHATMISQITDLQSLYSGAGPTGCKEVSEIIRQGMSLSVSLSGFPS